MRGLLLLLLVLGAPGIARAQELRRDPASGDFVLTFTDLDGVRRSVIVPARDKVDARMDLRIGETAGGLEYVYVLENRPTPRAKSPITRVQIDCPADARTAAPASWNASAVDQDGRNVCSFLFRTEWLEPGKMVEGLRLESTWLPAIVEARVVGHGRPVMWPSEEGAVPAEVYALADQVRGRTGGWLSLAVVAPGRSPDALADPRAGIVAVKGDLARVCSDRVWIANVGICRSLEAKLDAASRSLERGDTASARGQLQSFLRELEAQHGAQPGKHVSDNAYWLLKTNAEYVLSRL